MRIRWKLLVVLLFISLVPILLMRWVGQRSMRELGDDLAINTVGVLIRRASLELKSLVEEHSTILGRERDLVEMVLQVQAFELEKKFAEEPFQSKIGHSLSSDESGAGRIEFKLSTKHFMGMGMMGNKPLQVSYQKQSYQIPAGIKKKESVETVNRASAMVPVYRALERKHPDLIFWQLTVFENGIQTIYPAVQRLPMMLKAFPAEWYRLASKENQITWSKPGIDPLTMQMVFTVSTPVFKPDGSLIGVTAIMVPVNALLKVDEHVRLLSKNVTSLLVRTENSTTSDQPAVRILARGQIQNKIHYHWRAVQNEEWLELTDEVPREELISDLNNHTTGVRQIIYEGRESLAAYGCIDAYCTALLLIVPKEDLVAEAVNMGSYVLNRIGQQITATRILLSAVVLAVIALALILSRSVTQNISRLAEAAHRVASGDFSARVNIRSRDEMGELAGAFNTMVPELEERVRMKQALDLAMEVQQNLLPQQIPEIEGLDIAGRSIYCDETGGDLYDFIRLRRQSKNALGIAVGDVSGHGISAALLMATIRAFIKSSISQSDGIGRSITGVNRLMVQDMRDTGQFVTLFYVEIFPQEKSLRWVRAGHDPALIYDPETDNFIELLGNGVALGINADVEYQENIHTGFSKGQILLIGTDGLWEARNHSAEMFGKQRLKALIRRVQHLSSQELIDSIIDSLKKFQGSVRQEDDITVVVVKALD